MVRFSADALDDQIASELPLLRGKKTNRRHGIFVVLRLVGVSLGTCPYSRPNHSKRYRNDSRARAITSFRCLAKSGFSQRFNECRRAIADQPEANGQSAATHSLKLVIHVEFTGIPYKAHCILNCPPHCKMPEANSCASQILVNSSFSLWHKTRNRGFVLIKFEENAESPRNERGR